MTKILIITLTSLLVSATQGNETGGTIPDEEFIFHDAFIGDGLATNTVKGGGMVSIGVGGASWGDSGSGNAVYANNGEDANNRALLYSQNTFQSDTGFVLSVVHEVRNIGDNGSHNFSFGLISSDTDLSSYSGLNPFGIETGVYSIGANLATDGGVNAQGLNFSNGSSVSTLDSSGTRQQFIRTRPSEVTIEIGKGGYWCYRIDGVYEASGALPDDFDLSKSFYIAVYGQDDNGFGKEIHAITLKNAYQQGERANHLRGSWNAGQSDASTMDAYGIRTVDSTLARLNEGSVVSAEHNAPHRLLEEIASGASSVGGAPVFSPVPETWGDLNDDEPDSDAYLNHIRSIRNLGFGVKVYSNSENFAGNNTGELQPFVDRWIQYCDTNPEVQTFINSQPYHTGIWNGSTQQYEDASSQYPMRRYMFCYAEFVLKEYAIRYGKYVSSWTFDAGNTMGANGDESDSGILAEQRIYQAFANAVHAGNPEIPIAFNNGRLSNDFFDTNNPTNTDPAFPFARSTHFEDFTFGHAHNGNNDHASRNVNPIRNETVFTSNYRHVVRMMETDGLVQTGGPFAYDDQVVGNFHSKLGTQSWRFSTPSAWTQQEFNDWNLQAMQAGGHMTWEGSIPRSSPILRDWAIELIKATDTHLALNEAPDTPRWSRAYTHLPAATAGEPYSHVLIEGEATITNDKVDFWDPEDDPIATLSAVQNNFFSTLPSWLSISQNPSNSQEWILSGTPTEASGASHQFCLVATDSFGNKGSRDVELIVNSAGVTPSLISLLTGASGYSILDTDEVFGFRSTDIPKSADLDGDDVYGTAGYFFYGNGTTNENTTSQSLPSWLSVQDLTTNIVARSSFTDFDDPTAPISGIVADWTTNAFGSHRDDSPGTWTPLLNFSVTADAPRIIRLGVVAGSQQTGDGRWDPSGLRLSLSGETPIEVTGLQVVDLGIFFFDLLLPLDFSGTFILGGQTRQNGPAISGLLFDAVAPSSSLYDSWAISQGLTNLEADATADLENEGIGDGIPNLLEFILNGDPNAVDLEILPMLMPNADATFNYTFTRLAESTSETLQVVEYSTDLINWDEIDVLTDTAPEVSISTSPLDSDWEIIEVQMPTSPQIAQEGRLFMRLRAEQVSSN